MSGYTDCACRDCFEIAISDTDEPALCWECEQAGCSAEGDCECQRPDAYGCDELAQAESESMALPDPSLEEV